MPDLIQIFTHVLNEFDNDSRWVNAPFEKIKILSNTKVGNVGQVFIEKVCEALSIVYAFPKNITGKRKTQFPWDIEILGVQFELKTATQDVQNKFQFNHIRYHRNYQALLCLGVAPDNLYFGIWSKADIVTGKAGALVSMEKSANASYKLTKSVNELCSIADFAQHISGFAAGFTR